jgi:RsiW-degrading membrane proteinase PrsW (M82 family)
MPGAQSYSAYPGYPGYQPHPAYPAYPPQQPYQPYPGYGPVPYPHPYWQPAPGQFYGPMPYQQPQRDGYQLAMSIVALVGSGLAILAGLVCAFFAALVATLPTSSQVAPDQLFSGELTLLAFACAGIIGGGFSLYHSIRALLRKPSAPFALPTFWIFAILYAVIIAIGFALKINKMAVSHAPLTALLIFMAAIFPALALLAIADRRLRAPNWPTTWRRFTLSLTSGATLSIGLALALELGLIILLVRGQAATNLTQCIDTPDLPVCQQNPSVYGFILIVAAIIAPLVEETVKPLAVALYIGRVRSATEAFIMGMAAGIGFDLIETVGYIGSGYHDWVSVALQRTGTGLLHGFGAAMVALGWYYLTHARDRRFLKAIGCWLYAVIQHAIWNGSVSLVLLPAPIGPTLSNWNLNLGFTTLPFPEIINIIEAIIFFGFFLYMTGRLKRTAPPPDSTTPAQLREPQLAARS